MALVRFQDGQIVDTERVVGLQKWEKFDTGEYFVSVNTLDGAHNFVCETQNDQEELTLVISKQLQMHLEIVDFIDIEFQPSVADKKVN